MYFFLKYIVTLFYKKLRTKIDIFVVCSMFASWIGPQAYNLLVVDHEKDQNMIGGRILAKLNRIFVE